MSQEFFVRKILVTQGKQAIAAEDNGGGWGEKKQLAMVRKKTLLPFPPSKTKNRYNIQQSTQTNEKNGKNINHFIYLFKLKKLL